MLFSMQLAYYRLQITSHNQKMLKSNKNVSTCKNWLTEAQGEVRILTKSKNKTGHILRINSACTRSLQRLTLLEPNNEDCPEGNRKRALQHA